MLDANSQAILIYSLFGIGLPLWFFYIRSVWRGTHPLSPPAGEPNPIGLVDVAALFLVAQVAVGLGLEVGRNLYPAAPDSDVAFTPQAMLLATSLQLSATLLVWFLIRRRHGIPFFSGDLGDWIRRIGIGFVAALMVIPPILVIHSLVSALIPYEHPTLNSFQEAGLLSKMAAWFSAVVVAPVYEELFYRGLLQRFLQRFPARNNEEFVKGIMGGRLENQPTDAVPAVCWRAILIPAALFALMHLGQGGAPVALFLFAIALGYLFDRTASVIPCITLHFSLNAITMIFATLGG